ncbi:hypothetical protein FORMA_07120 [Formosa sp. Hel3_A1_48]|jgi:hypothetical protein|uniref:hypothetical protein n=1 Tax=Formosa sp. Hel3_A1_48 TaxID=1336795 RepID=UPI00084E2F9F|nr:hypothetical protein [Formosa sp. Hel3_A1_48]AOR25885.1 hypothetical protein FORMA_07120 [Formosa sp. Hel3_A1_48]
MRKFILLALLTISFTAATQESVLLRLNYNQGDNYITSIELEQNMGEQGGMSMTMKMNSNVNSVDDELIMLESKIKSIAMNMNQGGMVMDYDSNKSSEELDQMGQMMKSQFDPILKATIYNSVDRYGNVLELKVEPTLPGMEQFTGSQNAINFPDEAVSVGSSWVSEADNQGMKIVTKYTVTSISDGMIYLDVSGDVSGIGVGTIIGKSTVEISSGIQTNATIEMTISAQGIEMNMVTSSTMKKV